MRLAHRFEAVLDWAVWGQLNLDGIFAELLYASLSHVGMSASARRALLPVSASAPVTALVQAF